MTKGQISLSISGNNYVYVLKIRYLILNISLPVWDAPSTQNCDEVCGARKTEQHM